MQSLIQRRAARTYWVSSDIKATRRLILKQGHNKVNDRKREVRTNEWQSHTLRGGVGGGWGERGEVGGCWKATFDLKTRSASWLILQTSWDALA